jgi:hypothetical protein
MRRLKTFGVLRQVKVGPDLKAAPARNEGCDNEYPSSEYRVA